MAVDIGRRADLRDNPRDGDLLAVEVITAVVKVVHAAVPFFETRGRKAASLRVTQSRNGYHRWARLSKRKCLASADRA
jgi:hypothetical protein